ncbi:hypothetical protein, partial [Bandra megavirus]
MPYDRAGFFNDCGAFGSGGSSCGSNYGRVNDAKLMKKELHYVETFAKAHNEEFNNNFNNNYFNNGYGCNNGGFYGGGCGPCNDGWIGGGGCGPCAPPCPP